VAITLNTIIIQQQILMSQGGMVVMVSGIFRDKIKNGYRNNHIFKVFSATFRLCVGTK